MAIDPNELERLRADFTSVRGTSFKEFFCPILLEDSFGPRGLMHAHVLNEKIKEAGRSKVIQRADVDNYFGETLEPDLIRNLNHAGYGEHEFFKQSKAAAFGRSGKSFKVFVPAAASVPPYPRIHLRNGEGVVYASPFIMGPPDEFEGMDEIQVESVIAFRESAIVGSLLKAAYLCLFRVMGYKIIDDPLLNVVRQMLAEFVQAKAPKEKAPAYFGSYRGSTQFVTNGALDGLPDSLSGQYFMLHHIDDIVPDMLFGLSCIFRLNGRTVLVMLPVSRWMGTNVAAIECYRHFLVEKDWPQVMRLARWVNDGWRVFPSPIRCTYARRT